MNNLKVKAVLLIDSQIPSHLSYDLENLLKRKEIRLIKITKLKMLNEIKEINVLIISNMFLNILNFEKIYKDNPGIIIISDQNNNKNKLINSVKNLCNVTEIIEKINSLLTKANSAA